LSRYMGTQLLVVVGLLQLFMYQLVSHLVEFSHLLHSRI
jgi:hypothetical protein